MNKQEKNYFYEIKKFEDNYSNKNIHLSSLSLVIGINLEKHSYLWFVYNSG